MQWIHPVQSKVSMIDIHKNFSVKILTDFYISVQSQGDLRSQCGHTAS